MDGNEPRELTAADVHVVAFAKPPIGRRGYNEDEVDEFLERIERRLLDPRNVRQPTASDIAAVSFSKPPIGMRGYHESEVDAFLESVVRQLERIDGVVAPRDAARYGEAPSLHESPKKPWYRFWS